ncbi:MAG: hypothetical protein IJ939_01920, partial [Clostridia bacterium]|nr:hypothetical protein [Clostridia bacterium]
MPKREEQASTAKRGSQRKGGRYYIGICTTLILTAKIYYFEVHGVKISKFALHNCPDCVTPSFEWSAFAYFYRGIKVGRHRSAEIFLT